MLKSESNLTDQDDACLPGEESSWNDYKVITRNSRRSKYTQW